MILGLSFPVYKGVMKKGYKVPTPIQRKVNYRYPGSLLLSVFYHTNIQPTVLSVLSFRPFLWSWMAKTLLPWRGPAAVRRLPSWCPCLSGWRLPRPKRGPGPSSWLPPESWPCRPWSSLRRSAYQGHRSPIFLSWSCAEVFPFVSCSHSWEDSPAWRLPSSSVETGELHTLCFWTLTKIWHKETNCSNVNWFAPFQYGWTVHCSAWKPRHVSVLFFLSLNCWIPTCHSAFKPFCNVT